MIPNISSIKTGALALSTALLLAGGSAAYAANGADTAPAPSNHGAKKDNLAECLRLNGITPSDSVQTTTNPDQVQAPANEACGAALQPQSATSSEDAPSPDAEAAIYIRR